MMDIITRIARQPAKLLAAVNAVMGLGLILGWWTFADSETVMGAILLALGAILAAVSEYLTPVGDPNLAVGTLVNANTTKAPTGVVVDKDQWDSINGGAV